MAESRVVKVAAGVAYEPVSWLSLGLAATAWTGQVVTALTLSTCEGVTCVQPENPDFDAEAEIRSAMLLSPGVHVGALVSPVSWLRLGAAWESGYTLRARSSLALTVPHSGAFARATVAADTTRATLHMKLPQKARCGILLQPYEALGLEVTAVWTQGSAHAEIRMDVEATIEDVLAMGDFQTRSVLLPRNHVDTVSWHTALRWSVLQNSAIPVTVRIGAMWEPSAIPQRSLTPMTIDSDKIMLGGGLALRVSPYVTVEVVATKMFLQSLNVRSTHAYQISITQPAFAGATPIGTGTYRPRFSALAVSMRYHF